VISLSPPLACKIIPAAPLHAPPARSRSRFHSSTTTHRSVRRRYRSVSRRALAPAFMPLRALWRARLPKLRARNALGTRNSAYTPAYHAHLHFSNGTAAAAVLPRRTHGIPVLSRVLHCKRAHIVHRGHFIPHTIPRCAPALPAHHAFAVCDFRCCSFAVFVCVCIGCTSFSHSADAAVCYSSLPRVYADIHCPPTHLTYLLIHRLFYAAYILPTAHHTVMHFICLVRATFTPWRLH